MLTSVHQWWVMIAIPMYVDGNLTVSGQFSTTGFQTLYAKEFNNYIVSGLYFVQESNACANTPYGGTYGNGMLEVKKMGNCCKQVYTHYSGAVWVRMNWFGTWQEWNRLSNL